MLPWEIVLDELSEGIITIGVDGRIERVNSAALELLGYAMFDELLGKPASLLIDDRCTDELLASPMAAGEVRHLDTILSHRDGRALAQQITLCGIDRGRTGVVLRPQIDEKEKDRYQILFEEIKAVMLLIDPDTGAIVDANPAASQYYGWSKEDLVQMCIDQINTLTGEQVRREMARAKKQEKEYFLFRHRLADGQVRDVEVYSNRIRVGGRDLLYSIVHDVQEKRALARELNNERSLFRELIEAIPDMVFFKDNKGHYIGANRAFASITGRKREDMIGKTDTDLFTEERAEFYQGQDLKVLANEEGIRYEQWIEGKRGRITVDVIKSPYRDAEGKIVGIIGVAREITRQKAMEHDLIEAKREAERANRLKTQFLANMSHEIRTPMNGIMGFLQLLGGTNLDDEQREYLSIIRHASDTLLNLINDILDLSKIESDNVDLETIPYDLPSVLESTLLTFSQDASEKGIDVSLTIYPGVPPILQGDPTRLRQVLNNLVGNAIKFTKEGSVAIRVTAEAETLIIRVIDTGIGMSEEVVHRVFSPFVQADASIARAHGGTGLGLAITRRLVEAMGGEIHVDSTEDVGTALTFTLPLSPIEAEDVWEDATFLRNRRIYFYGEEEFFKRLKSICTRGQGRLRRFKTIDGLAEALSDDRVHPDLMILQGAKAAERIQRQPDLHKIPSLVYCPDETSDKDHQASCVEGSKGTKLIEDMRRLIMEQVMGRESKKASASNGSFAATGQETARQEVLLVEDNPTNRLLLKKLLEKAGYLCDLATDGREAVARAEEKRYPVILMDCEMPYMDGYEATRRIRRLPGAHRPLIIALTAHAMEEDRQRCLDSGMDEYLSKPVDLNRLVGLLDKKWRR